MAKFMYWLWAFAEDRELSGSFPLPMWSRLLRACDRYHGYEYDEGGLIVSRSREPA